MTEFTNYKCSSNEHGFSYIHNINHSEKISASHIDKDLFSIFVLLNGELDYIIEGKQVHLLPNDLLLVGNNELHQSIFKKGVDCEYVLLMLNLDFFIKNNCNDFADMVFNRTLGSNNIITSEKTMSSGIIDIIKRLDMYAKESPANLTVVSCVIIELLYALNKQVVKSQKSIHKQNKIKDIIEYINQNLTEELSLETIAAKFFLTKQHLCKIFKAGTGFTINKYLSYKRIVLVRELYSKGQTLSEACSNAGFKDYSSFYRAYSKIMNAPPSKHLTK